MTSDPFAHLPDSARLWVFGSSRALEPAEADRLLTEVDRFLDGWRAHGHPLAAARRWAYGRFLVVTVDERVTPPSGCSIDALVRTLKQLEEELDLTLVDGGAVFYREGAPDGAVRRTDRAGFRRLAEEGEVDPDTVVFDTSLTRLGELREGRWEGPARDRWHGRAFFGIAR